MSWPRTNDPRTNFVTLRLTDSEAADVDWLAAMPGNHGKKGPNRSEAVRNAVGRVVTAEKKRAARDKSQRQRETRALTDD